MQLTFNFLENCFNSRWLFFQRHSHGRFINIYNNEIGKISSTFYDFVTQSSMAIKFLTYLVTPFFLNFQITITTLVLAIIFTAPFLLLGKIANKLGYKFSLSSFDASNSGLSGNKLIASFARYLPSSSSLHLSIKEAAFIFASSCTVFINFNRISMPGFL